MKGYTARGIAPAFCRKRLHPRQPATRGITPANSYSNYKNIGRKAAAALIQRNQIALPHRNDVYLFVDIPHNDVRPIAIAGHNTF